MKKLFSKCGPLIQARFDTNEHGQYLGTATVIYQKASAALRAVTDYNGASLDNRVMRVFFADDHKRPEQPKPLQTLNQQRFAAAKKARREKALKMRKTGARISKNKDNKPTPGGQQT
jgi:RNA recognition motif-containing protein